ncbi:MAG: glycerol-3-phosphate dehydrogenase/oxidase [Luminiphilus sp.]|jgi:glycerol-3-phosphate dehydrogenase|nr:glycerol-3-phosphate dehydrogenase/oxidase [Luminiphilus sp.]
MTKPPFNQSNRRATVSALSDQVFDLLVIGGGITGAGVARDAAMRGLSVALIEAQDLASGTSSRSSKMIHGGLRYLVAGDVAVVKESASERSTLHRIAPHLAQKTPYVIPTGSMRSKLLLRGALWAYERLGGVEPQDYHESWSVDQLAEQEPLVERSRLNGAVVYPEFLTDDSRLTLATVRSAIEYGATVSTYLKATSIRREGDFVVNAASTLPGDTSEVTLRARAVVNAAGPWVDEVCGLERDHEPRLALSRGVHLVFNHADLPVRSTVVMRTHDGRRIFAVPLGLYTYIGTTDDYHPDCEYWPPVTEQDVRYLLSETQRVMPETNASANNIVSVWSGIRPLVGDGSGRASKELSRKDEVWTSASGLLSVGGGKLSAYRAMAERIVDTVAANNAFTAKPCATAEIPLPGGEAAVSAHFLTPVEGAQAERLARLYGAEAPGVASVAADKGLVMAEVQHAVLNEGALRLEDYWARRSSRAWFDQGAGLPILSQAAHAMAEWLSWDQARITLEIDNCHHIDRESRAGFLEVTGWQGETDVCRATG